MFITQRGLAVDKQSMHLHPASLVLDQAHASSHRRSSHDSCGAPLMKAQAASAVCNPGVC